MADTFDKIDLDMPTVHLVGEIEQMNLEQETVVTRESRPVADIGHTRQGLVGKPQHLDREDAAQGGRSTQQRHVHGRKADRATALVTMPHPPADSITPAQAALGMRQVASSFNLSMGYMYVAVPIGAAAWAATSASAWRQTSDTALIAAMKT